MDADTSPWVIYKVEQIGVDCGAHDMTIMNSHLVLQLKANPFRPDS